MEPFRTPPPIHPRAPGEAPRVNLVPWAALAAAAGVGWFFRDVFYLLGAAFGLAWLLAPAVSWLTVRRVPRPVAIAVVLVSAGLVTTVLLWIAVPDIVTNVTQLVATVPQRIQQDWAPRVSRALLYVRHRFHVRVPVTADAWISQLAARASTVAQGSISVVLSAAGASISVVEAAVELLIVLALAFYMLADWHPILDGALDLVPQRARGPLLRVVGKVDAALGRFVRGQLRVMAILGALFAIGLGTLHVPAGVGLGIFAGLITFVPYLGFLLALAIALLLAALDPTGQCSVPAVLGYMLVVHLLDILVLTPRVVGGSIGLSPVVVIVALLAGGQLAGFFGLLVAVPVAAVVRVLLGELVDWYKSTRFYRAPPSHTLDTDASLDADAAPAPRLTQPPSEHP